MDVFTQSDLTKLLSEHRPPCISIFLPTRRKQSDQNQTRLKNLLVDAEDQLKGLGIPKGEIKELLAPANNYFDDKMFWQNQSDGLVIFLAANFMQIYRLPIAFDEAAYVGMQFHITPLLPLTSGNGSFFVLALSKKSVRLLQGNRFNLSEIDLKGVPRSLAEALLLHDRDEPLTFHTRPTSGGTWGAIYEGHGVVIDDAKDDLLLYFQKIDRGLHSLLHDEKAPLVLAAVNYFHPIYRKANTYPHLCQEGISGSPDHMSNRELHHKAWELLANNFAEDKSTAMNRYHQLEGTGRTASELNEIVTASNEGHVEALFIPQNRACWGRLGRSGDIEFHETRQPGDEELINLAAVNTLTHGHPVYEMEPDPTRNGGRLSAIFNLPMEKHGRRPG